MTEVFDTFTYVGRCGHTIYVRAGREQPHECERPSITLS